MGMAKAPSEMRQILRAMDTEKGISFAQCVVLVISGILVGGGAILPGISGGVLCVIFGIYRPMMAILSHPRKAIPQYWRMFIPFGIGWLLGFWIFAKVLSELIAANATVATWLFIGLIAGTVPSLIQEANSKGRERGSLLSGIIAFCLMFGVLLWVKLGSSTAVTPNFGWNVFCGVLWGLSLIVPGLSSSSTLMALGLYYPLMDGISSLKIPVVLSWGLGLLVTVLLLARLVNGLFDKHYSIAFYAVTGIVLASTAVIIPVSPSEYGGVWTIVISAACAAAGFVAAWLMGKLDSKKQEAALEPDAAAQTADIPLAQAEDAPQDAQKDN